MLRWFVNRPNGSGCVYYRQTLPIRHLMPWLANQGVRITYSETLDTDEKYDAYFFARWCDPRYVPFLFELKHRGAVVVWDLDDDLFAMDRYEEKYLADATLSIAALALCLEVADVITVTNEVLRDRVNWPEKTVVVPNLIDLDDNQISPFYEKRNAILYTASPSHKWDLELIHNLHQETQREFSWVWYGIKPEFVTLRDTLIPWARVTDYPKVCRLIRPLVALAPLANDRFNQGKSPIKIWETATAGASVIASDYGPYAGSASAIVPAGEEFRREHLDQVLAVPNYWDCMAEAKRNSWQYCVPGRKEWMNMFQHVLFLCRDSQSLAV